MVGWTSSSIARGGEIDVSIDELLPKVDVVLLESVDGRPHLAQATPCSKPASASSSTSQSPAAWLMPSKIFELSKQTKTPVFSSSSLRYYPNFRSIPH